MPNSWGTSYSSAPADCRCKTSRWLVALAAIIGCQCAAALGAEIAAVSPVPDSVRQASALTPEQIQAVGAAVHRVAAVLADGSRPTAQSEARRALIAAASDTAGAPSSPAYLDVLGKSVNAELLAVATGPKANIRAKIQAGFIAQAIAAKSPQNTELAPLVSGLLADPSPPVALIGLKALGGLLPAMLNSPRLSEADKHLMDQIFVAVEQHTQPPLGAAIAQDAYDALAQPVFGANGVDPRRIHDVILPLVLKLEETRLKQYQTGRPPQGPQGDATGLVILLAHDTWLSMSAAEQKQALKIASESIAATAKVARDLKSQKTSAAADAAPFLEALRRDADELKLIASPGNGWAPSPAVYAAASTLSHLGPGSAATAIQNASEATVRAMTELGGSL